MINETKTLIKKITLINVANFALAIAGIVNLVAGSYYMIYGNGTLASAGIAAGLVLVLASTIDRFESLKGLGIEAKTRELNKTLIEAEVVIDRMKRVTEMTGGALVNLVVVQGRPFAKAMAAKEIYELSRSVKKILEDVGTEGEKIKDALAFWAFYACDDLIHDILKRYEDQVKAGIKLVNRNDPVLMNPLNEGYQKAKQIQDGTEIGYLRAIKGKFSSKPIENYPNILRSLTDNFPPIISKKAQDQLTDDVDKWAPEIEYLVEHLDFNDKKSWIDILDKHRDFN